ncbi:MAG TPA: hypothetical protein VLT79_10660 [Gemmatimonadales bacterium]|nr:hypothetical protein [Gemmatimonadales bacterium]
MSVTMAGNHALLIPYDHVTGVHPGQAVFCPADYSIHVRTVQLAFTAPGSSVVEVRGWRGYPPVLASRAKVLLVIP